MTYSPVVPMSGLSGWKFLQSTMDRQRAQFDKSPDITRDAVTAREKLAQAKSIADITQNRATLRVVLGAYGLQDDINNKFLIEKIMTSDMTDPKSLANRMSDQRYKDLARAVAPIAQHIPMTDFRIGKIVDKFSQSSFEIAVGETDADLRLALNATHELADIAQSGKSEKTMWYQILGTPPLTKVFQTALRLPSSFSKLDLEKQTEVLQSKLLARTGNKSLTQFSDPKAVEKFVTKFLLQSQINIGASQSGASNALTLLQGLDG